MPNKLLVFKVFKTVLLLKIAAKKKIFSEHFLSGFFNKNCLLWLYSVQVVLIGNLDEIS